MPRGRLRLCVMFLALLLSCRFGVAQAENARLEGVIYDPSGAVVTEAEVSIVNASTQAQARMSSTSEGCFIFLSLQPGLYKLRVKASGFPDVVIPNLELNVGATLTQNIKLEIGSIEEHVEVRAEQERVQTADAEIARVVTLRDIQSLPQLGRGPLELAIFSPGVQIDASDPSVSQINGTRMGSNETRLDGMDVSDQSAPRLMLSNNANNADSIQEFRIITAGGKAEYGRNVGGQIQLITRSGTNSWHGNMFEYHRNEALNANTFFGNASGLPRPAYIQNTFGASLGGPVLHDRSFIFGNYQGRRNAQQVVRNRLVLTPEAKAGLFRWKTPESSEIHSFDIVGNDPRGIGIDPEVAEILKLLPDPNNYDIGDRLNTAGFRFNNPAISSIGDITEDQFTIKADHALSSSHHLFFRWSWHRRSFIDVINGTDARFPGQPSGTQGGRNWGYSIGSDWTITPHIVNELRVGQKTYIYDFLRPARLPGPMLLSNSWIDPLDPAFPSRWKPSSHQITDNITIVRGSHTLKGGIDVRLTLDRKSKENGIWPNVYFGSSYGNAPPTAIGPNGPFIAEGPDRQSFERLYNDLLGRMNLVTQTFYSDLKSFQETGTSRIRNHRYLEFSCFIQDDWRIHPRLTLNLGLRYELFSVPHEVNGFQGTVDKADLINSTARLADLTVRPDSHWYNNDLNNFAPRIGLAWDPAGNGKMALRANWGIFYDRLIGRTTDLVDANTPGFSLPVPVYVNSAGTDIRVSDGIPLPDHPAVPELRPAASRSTDLFLFSPDLRTGYVQHFSITFQREIFRNTVIEAGYVGTYGIKLFMDLNLNQPRIYEDFLAAFKDLQAHRQYGTPVPVSNTLVRIFGSPDDAISEIGSGTIDQGAVGAAADTVDRGNYSKFAQAGVSDFYLRNFPQFNQVVLGTNDGRSYYNSAQLTLRRQTGALKFAASYTFSKSMDNISTDGRIFTSPVDNFNVRLNRARSDFDIPHSFNLSLVYTLPFGKGRRYAGDIAHWADSLIGGWDIGLLALWQSGRVINYLSGRATGPTTDISFVDYIGDRNIGRIMRRSDGVYWLTPEDISKFSFPDAGETGTAGRNAFRGPRFFDVDLSLVKKVPIGKTHAIAFRAEAYNLFNNTNFGLPNNDLTEHETFGKISTTIGTARILQMALRYDF